jgi:hypothetical protein
MSDAEFAKRGLLFELPRDLGWAASHAAIPTPERLDDGTYNVYYSARDAANRASIGRFRLSIEGDGLRVVEVERSPILGLGELGAFDDGGVTVSCVVQNGGRKYLYYTGWSLGVSVPFYMFAGLAISEDGGATFRRSSQAPILERDAVDPYLTASPYVIVENGRWRMWYVSCSRWEQRAEGPRHFYHIRYAESSDGIHWRREGRVAIEYAGETEYALARPFVFPAPGGYEMWFSHRGTAYRLGRAVSNDGLAWTRMEPPLLDVSPAGWDSEMVAYAAAVRSDNRLFLLYNGNGYGATGIGYAVAHAP